MDDERSEAGLLFTASIFFTLLVELAIAAESYIERLTI